MHTLLNWEQLYTVLSKVLGLPSFSIVKDLSPLSFVHTHTYTYITVTDLSRICSPSTNFQLSSLSHRQHPLMSHLSLSRIAWSATAR
ncbi:hypothetical protein PISMIDRAFT_578553 [Pisolithus microcarpus 441]|uniref:Uncharacterized protein n=1 Tax=Pisolithus microcarpus 441 TaxID=765257 RepID=A0A0C9YV28_9AGAM|nr:hypothetical protein PISMIDRAFT_578553 [Pisolithus microcarpus 441]